jgi:hypothetical protein
MTAETGPDPAAPRPEAQRIASGSTASQAAKHASGLYGRTFRAALRPIRSAESEAHHLHMVEHEGEADVTPYIATLGVFLFLLPIFLVILGLAFAAYYLST